MAVKIIWTFIAAFIGVLFSIAVIKAELIFGGTAAAVSPNGRMILYGLLAGATAIFSGAGFLVGSLKSDLLIKTRELDEARSRLDDAPQQAEIRKLMEELSGNLDHLQDITNNIDEGICVIDVNGSIEYGFNSRFKGMFGAGDYTGKPIMETVFRNIAPDLKREIKEYVELCFRSASTSDSMLNDVNPVSKFTYYNPDGDREKEKILKSKIVRIKNHEGDIENIMFIFTDITLDEKMDVAFEKHEKAFQDEMSIMALIYKNDKDMMINFINESNSAVEQVQQKYLEIEQDENNDGLLRGIQGVIHLIKGEAFSLGFSEVAKSAEEMENFIKSIAGGKTTLEHNLSLIALYENLYNNVNKVNGVAQKLFSIGEGTRKFSRDFVSVDAGRYRELKYDMRVLREKFLSKELLPEDIARVQKGIENLDTVDLSILEKEIVLICEKSALSGNVRATLNFIYDIDGLPDRHYRLVKEALVHLVRNSIAHGIEEVSVRKEKEKDVTGKINIHLYREQSQFIVLYADDGAGFNVERIKLKAVENGFASREELDGMPDNKVLGFAFKEGFSTTEKADMISGTGIGLSVVRNNIVHELNGSIRIRNRPDRGVSITMSFP